MAPENSLEQSQSQSTGGGRKVDETLVTQGTVLWLPAKEDLPKHAVRRAHGKGAVEEGIFNHPIVVVSRPKDQSDIIHFHLVSALSFYVKALLLTDIRSRLIKEKDSTNSTAKIASSMPVAGPGSYQ